MTRKALGKGLSALLREVEHPAAQPPAVAAPPVPAPAAGLPLPQPAPTTGGIQEIPLDLIVASTFQPRTHFEKSALDELAQSMRTGGVVQPVSGRPMGESFE